LRVVNGAARGAKGDGATAMRNPNHGKPTLTLRWPRTTEDMAELLRKAERALLTVTLREATASADVPADEAAPAPPDEEPPWE
jgi:hypothetical protein